MELASISIGAEGPGALQVLIKVPLVFPDLGGLQSLAAAQPINARHWTHVLLRQNKACSDQHGAEGPGALQTLIKVPMVFPDNPSILPSFHPSTLPCFQLHKTSNPRLIKRPFSIGFATNMKVFPLLIALSWFLIEFASSSHAAEILVFAAVSLSEALKECASNYQQESGDTVSFSFGGSNDLARQIDAGAPADLFFSADEAKMDFLEKKGRLLAGTRRSILSNSLVIIEPKGAPGKLSEPTQLADNSFVHALALANPDAVPAGIYAKEYLKKIKIWEKISAKVVPTENVRACLAAVESKNVDAGIVYKTDALISKEITVVYEVPASESPQISYPLAVIKESANAQPAERFAEYLESREAAKIFEKHGFTIKE